MRVFEREIDGVPHRVRAHGPFPLGATYRGHRHYTDHRTFVPEGTRLRIEYRLQAGDANPLKVEEVDGPARVLIAAGLFHTITALTDDAEWQCEFVIPPAGSPLARVFADEMID